MAGPTTETLSEDAKELSREVLNLRSDLSREISNSRLELSRDIADSREEFVGFQSRVTTQLAIIKWVGVFFSTMFLAFFCGTVGFAWNSGLLYAEVKGQGKRIQRLETKSDELFAELARQGKRIERIEDEVARQGKRIEKIEDELARQGKRIEKIGTVSERILEKLDRIEARLNRPKATSPDPDSPLRKGDLP